ncbi:hypothetical protein LTR56_027106 [Elasticomyces elasticus]|nr:hypothetical protein LTR56_027106 [Elasticomyces elasticus]KAK3647010.1 hypothetical protein LTR22_014039 [Elasticomyces elasticus]KAK4916915.1 hypothetical protein LTR49_015088 [Elasticomyces elasticus]KAK5754169.1 hypothetical protein LTS12_015695 [Elasticomyces elasticus]
MDGRSTLGRAAEEGRGQVNFAPGTGPQATSTPEIITTTPAGENLVAFDPHANTADKVTNTATPADMEKAANVTNIYNNNDGRGTSGRDLVTVTLTAAMILFTAA